MRRKSFSLNKAKTLYPRHRRVAISQSKDLNSKKLLFKMPFFQSLLKNDDEHSKDIVQALWKAISFINLFQGDTFASIDTTIKTVNFLLLGELALIKESDLNSTTEAKVKANQQLIKEGEEFGADSNKYTHTLKAECSCLIGMIPKDQFNAIIIKQNQYESKHDFGFFSNLPFFKGLKKSNIECLVGNALKRELRKGEIIGIQGKPFTTIYIVRKGQIKLSFTKKTSYSNDFDITFFQLISDANDRFSSLRQCELMSSYDEIKTYPVFIVCNGDIIGDFELKYKMNSYCLSSSCEIDYSIIYEIPLSLFQKVMSDEFYEKLKVNLIPKEKLFLKRLNTVVKNTKVPASKYDRRIEEKIPSKKHKEDFVLPSYSQSPSKKKLVNEKRMKMKFSLDMSKLSRDVNNTNTNNAGGKKNMKSINKRLFRRHKNLSTELFYDNTQYNSRQSRNSNINNSQ